MQPRKCVDEDEEAFNGVRAGAHGAALSIVEMTGGDDAVGARRVSEANQLNTDGTVSA